VCYLITDTVTYDSSYRWHCGSCVLPTDCRVVNGLLDEDIMKDTSLAKRECRCLVAAGETFPPR
jgi:hypothetical protein